ncbi:hypothetical protein BU24DRAFT_457390 [Aaosphaeria arxii CBS 175.79]|uniref:Uncharacterized protein n=1 Tax=Aaosphaeria arxii CBS 175.79 TaxID=1450172 RepID=A0A6A5Y7A0_9PLEO|nr:uncharacterized protein BU24DRAFT_457390 [Aaosphaeria arxii CBS 175.79]KAF2021408.1 hypothetical protein BU24DRAFT_457390 [Aaosphaeria arxii CBS 175.79]
MPSKSTTNTTAPSSYADDFLRVHTRQPQHQTSYRHHHHRHHRRRTSADWSIAPSITPSSTSTSVAPSAFSYIDDRPFNPTDHLPPPYATPTDLTPPPPTVPSQKQSKPAKKKVTWSEPYRKAVSGDINTSLRRMRTLTTVKSPRPGEKGEEGKGETGVKVPRMKKMPVLVICSGEKGRRRERKGVVIVDTRGGRDDGGVWDANEEGEVLPLRVGGGESEEGWGSSDEGDDGEGEDSWTEWSGVSASTGSWGKGGSEVGGGYKPPTVEDVEDGWSAVGS